MTFSKLLIGSLALGTNGNSNIYRIRVSHWLATLHCPKGVNIAYVSPQTQNETIELPFDSQRPNDGISDIKEFFLSFYFAGGDASENYMIKN